MLELQIVHNFISGLVSGVIFYQSIIVASTVFKTLNINQSSILLRSIFPKFFKVIFLLGLISLIFSFILKSQIYLYIVGGLTSILALICLFIIPMTNKAKDQNDNKSFKLLHSISVIFTMAILILNVSIIFIFNIN